MPKNMLLLALVVSMVFGATSLSQTPLDAGEHHVEVDGIRLWYKLAGAATEGQAPVLYLPGGPGYNSYSFERTIGSQLEPHMQMLYFDERGTGRSEQPKNKDFAITTLVQDVEALRLSLGIPQLSLMGHSFGGIIALEYAAKYPEHVQKLILVDGVSDIPDAFAHWQREIEDRYPLEWKTAMAHTDGKVFARAERSGDACSISKARFQVEMGLLRTVDADEFHHWQQFHTMRFQREQETIDQEGSLPQGGDMGNAFFSPGNDFLCYHFNAYDRITMPVLIIAGKYDGAADPEQLRLLAHQIKGAQFDEFENSAHFPYAEEPGKFERDVAAFVSSTSGAGSPGTHE